MDNMLQLKEQINKNMIQNIYINNYKMKFKQVN